MLEREKDLKGVRWSLSETADFDSAWLGCSGA